MSTSDSPNHVANFDGKPGMVWYAKSTPTYGHDLKLHDWLDSLDHRGARAIHGLSINTLKDTTITVTFFGGDTETVRADVQYDVVDPDSQVTPDGTPVTTEWPEDYDWDAED